MLTEKKYGQPPVDLGRIDLSVDEMMFWMYCPVKLKGNSINYKLNTGWGLRDRQQERNPPSKEI